MVQNYFFCGIDLNSLILNHKFNLGYFLGDHDKPMSVFGDIIPTIDESHVFSNSLFHHVANYDGAIIRVFGGITNLPCRDGAIYAGGILVPTMGCALSVKVEVRSYRPVREKFCSELKYNPRVAKNLKEMATGGPPMVFFVVTDVILVRKGRGHFVASPDVQAAVPNLQGWGYEIPFISLGPDFNHTGQTFNLSNDVVVAYGVERVTVRRGEGGEPDVTMERVPLPGFVQWDSAQSSISVAM